MTDLVAEGEGDAAELLEPTGGGPLNWVGALGAAPDGAGGAGLTVTAGLLEELADGDCDVVTFAGMVDAYQDEMMTLSRSNQFLFESVFVRVTVCVLLSSPPAQYYGPRNVRLVAIDHITLTYEKVLGPECSRRTVQRDRGSAVTDYGKHAVVPRCCTIYSDRVSNEGYVCPCAMFVRPATFCQSLHVSKGSMQDTYCIVDW